MTYDDLISIVGQSAADEFNIVFGDWLKENIEDTSIIDHYETALLMFGAGYIARRNDELLREKGVSE